jgi:hypothetical protein
MRLNRCGCDLARRWRGFLLSRVGIWQSSKLFMELCCSGQKHGAPRELLNPHHFLAVTYDATQWPEKLRGGLLGALQERFDSP